jgi:hydrogenase maturation factor
VNLVNGVIAEIRYENGQRVGKVRVGGAIKSISLDLLADPALGDKVLVCEGVALAKVEDPVT